MKKLTGLRVIVVALLLAIMLVLPIKGYADWVLYDNFESPTIDWSLWDPYGDWTGAEGERYIQDGELKIILNADTTGDTKTKFGLSFKQNLEDIEAIRAKVMIDSCIGDGRVKIRGEWIYDSPYEFQQAINIYGASGEIVAWGHFYNSDTGQEFFIDKLSSDNSIDIMGKDFVVTIWFLSDKPKFRVRQLGKIVHVQGANIIAPV